MQYLVGTGEPAGNTVLGDALEGPWGASGGLGQEEKQNVPAPGLGQASGCRWWEASGRGAAGGSDCRVTSECLESIGLKRQKSAQKGDVCLIYIKSELQKLLICFLAISAH